MCILQLSRRPALPLLAGWLAAAALVALPGLAIAQQGPSIAGGAGGAAASPSGIEPAYTIWDVKLGDPVSKIPDADIVNVTCGTNGGPPSLPLKNFSEFAKCPAEASGLHEVHFEYDDEQAYVAKALELEYRFLQAGTSVYAHPVLLSVLVDDKGLAQGFRIVTDDGANAHDRRGAYQLEDNLRSRYGSWDLNCQSLPPTGGEDSVGNIFVHDFCTGTDPASGDHLSLEARYMRLKGMVGIDPQTQQVQRQAFYSSARLEVVTAAYQPAPRPALPQAPAGG